MFSNLIRSVCDVLGELLVECTYVVRLFLLGVSVWIYRAPTSAGWARDAGPLAVWFGSTPHCFVFNFHLKFKL